MDTHSAAYRLASRLSFRLFSYSSLSSTMDGARELARQGFGGGAIVRADTQRAGRGRTEGRVWRDEPGKALLMTMLLPSEFPEVKALPLRVGLGVTRALEESCLKEAGNSSSGQFLLKWPNDVLARLPTNTAGPNESSRYGKLCGILCEVSIGRVLIGIGINLKAAPPPRSDSDLAPAWLEAALGALPRPFDAPDVAASLVARHVANALVDPQWRLEYERKLWGLGSGVQFLAGHPERPESVQGLCAGVDDDGRLILDIGGQRRAFASGEIASLRLV